MVGLGAGRGARARGGTAGASRGGPAVRDALLEVLFGAGSDLLIVPVQDIFGWRDRVNTPAVVDEINWTWRLPWPAEDLMREPAAQERAAFVRRLADRHRR
jgi:4-alpha-glucanotransferase